MLQKAADAPVAAAPQVESKMAESENAELPDAAAQTKRLDKGKGKARDDEVTGEEDDGSGFNGCSSEEVNEAIQFVRRSMAPASESSRHGMQVSIYPCVRHFTSVCLT